MITNWCENRLTIKGQKEELKKLLINFWDDDKKEFSMHNIIPATKANNRIMLWGTKWDICCDNSLDRELSYLNSKSFNGEIILEYETPEDTNKKFLLKISSLYKTLEFKLDYYKPDLLSIGTLSFKNNRILKTKNVNLEDSNSEIEFLSLLLDLNFDDISYFLSFYDLEDKTLNYIRSKILNNEKEECLIIDYTDVINNASSFPDPEQ